MAVSKLYNLNRPERAALIETENANIEDFIKASYPVWLAATKGQANPRTLYDEARKLIEPYKDKFSGVLTAKELGAVTTHEKGDSGAYVAALLNETKIEKLSLGQPGFYCQDPAVFLKPGKAVELLEDAEISFSLGLYAEGGTIINNARRAPPFDFVNYIGAEGRSCIMVNRGSVSFMGHQCTGCTAINLLDAGQMGKKARDSVFVSRQKQDQDHVLSGIKSPCWYVGPKELEGDGNLDGFVSEIEKASIESDVPKVNEAAHKIDAHVRRNYNPRKVA